MKNKKPPSLDTTVNDEEIARLEKAYAPKRYVPKSLKELEREKKDRDERRNKKE